MRLASALFTTAPVLAACRDSGTDLTGAGDGGAVEPAPGSEPDPATSGGAGGLPDGLTLADLPTDVGDRREMLADWFEEQDPDLHSGSGNSGTDAIVLNLADRAEAEAKCGLFVDAVAVWFADIDVVGVEVDEWVRQEDGFFEDPGWETIDCH